MNLKRCRSDRFRIWFLLVSRCYANARARCARRALAVTRRAHAPTASPPSVRNSFPRQTLVCREADTNAGIVYRSPNPRPVFYFKGEVSPSLQPSRRLPARDRYAGACGSRPVFRYPLCGGHPRNAPTGTNPLRPQSPFFPRRPRKIHALLI